MTPSTPTKKQYHDTEITYYGVEGIKVPVSFLEAMTNTPQLLEEVVNDCGAKIHPGQSWFIRTFYRFLRIFINTIWFLNIAPICQIHDWGYFIGEDERDREHYDHQMLDNLLTWITAKTRFTFLRSMRIHRVILFYIALRNHGSAAFWYGKEQHNV